MKAIAGVLFLTLAAPSVAQAPSPESILIGDFGEVRLFLGESKDSALRGLREHFDISIEDPKDGQIAIFSLGSLSPEAKRGIHYGWVTFRNGKLSTVTKLWDIHGLDGGVAVARAIRGAMSSFGTSGRACSVVTFDNQEPSMEKSGVVVSCGKRQVQIFTNRWAFNTGSGEGVVINEVLSTEP
jgi:hypothetical protein